MAVTLVNGAPDRAAPTAEFRLFQGGLMIARIGVHVGGRASIPITTSYSAQARTSMGDFSLTSNTVNFATGTTNLLAQVLMEDGYYDFQLVQAPPTEPSAIVFENTWRSPVQFTLTQPGTPVQIVTVVKEHDSTVVSTAPQWTCYAIANGITTATVAFADPGATVTLTAAADDDGFTLTVS